MKFSSSSAGATRASRCSSTASSPCRRSAASDRRQRLPHQLPGPRRALRVSLEARFGGNVGLKLSASALLSINTTGCAQTFGNVDGRGRLPSRAQRQGQFLTASRSADRASWTSRSPTARSRWPPASSSTIGPLVLQGRPARSASSRNGLTRDAGRHARPRPARRLLRPRDERQAASSTRGPASQYFRLEISGKLRILGVLNAERRGHRRGPARAGRSRSRARTSWASIAGPLSLYAWGTIRVDRYCRHQPSRGGIKLGD